MELVPGRSLDRVITEDGPLPPVQAAWMASSLLGPLAAAHAAGVLHRGVAPARVLISPERRAPDRVVLTGFGMASPGGGPGQPRAGWCRARPDSPRQSCSGRDGHAGFGPVVARRHAVRGGGGTQPVSALRRPAVLTAGDAAAGEAAGGSPRAPSAGLLGPAIEALLRPDPAQRPDPAAAARLLDEALAGARSGPEPPSASAGSVNRPRASGSPAVTACPPRRRGAAPGRAAGPAPADRAHGGGRLLRRRYGRLVGARPDWQRQSSRRLAVPVPAPRPLFPPHRPVTSGSPSWRPPSVPRPDSGSRCPAPGSSAATAW